MNEHARPCLPDPRQQLYENTQMPLTGRSRVLQYLIERLILMPMIFLFKNVSGSICDSRDRACYAVDFTGLSCLAKSQ